MKSSHSLLLSASFGIISLSSIPSCSRNSAHITKKIIISKQKKTDILSFLEPPAITIWIHGTRLMRRPLYYQYFDGKPSLKLAKNLESTSYFYSLAKAFNEASPEKFSLNHFYIFGWSGKLNSTERVHSAQALLDKLEPIVSDYEKHYHHKPKIRIIAHSHGGNVALNCSKIIKEKLLKTNFYINELILLGCPVQSETRDLIASPFFKQIYAFYSSLDIIQIIAPEMMKITISKKGSILRQIKIPPVSARMFPSHKQLTQIKIKLNGRALWHTEFASQAFIEALPTILAYVQEWHIQELQFLTTLNSPLLLSAYIK